MTGAKRPVAMGDTLASLADYPALLAAMTSPYVDKGLLRQRAPGDAKP